MDYSHVESWRIISFLHVEKIVSSLIITKIMEEVDYKRQLGLVDLLLYPSKKESIK